MSVGLDGSTANVPPEASMSAVVFSPVNSSAVPSHRDIASRLLGEIAVPSDQIFGFPEGLHGFAEQTEYALIPAARSGFWWLQSTEVSELAFLLADPFVCAPGFEVDLSEGDRQFLGLTSPEDAIVLTVVTLPASNGQSATTNLRGPVVFSAMTRRARQVVSANDGHSLHAVMDLADRETRVASTTAV